MDPTTPLELAELTGDRGLLSRLAERTGGRYFNYRTISELETLVDAIPTDPQVLTEVKTIEVWDGMTFLMIFLVLVSVELSLRKWWGLL